MRVLHIYKTYFPETKGGAQESIRQLCIATNVLGVKNTIFALAHRPEPQRLLLTEGLLIRARSWIEIASCDIGGWEAIKRCREAADQCDLIQIHYPWPFADLMLPWIRKQNQPLVVTYISDIVRQNDTTLGKLYAPVRRRLLDSADRVVTSSPNYAESSPILRRYRKKLSYIAHCIEPAPQVPPATAHYWLDRFGTNFFLFVGVLRYYKGLDYLLQAASQVQATILVVGDGPEGDRLQKEAQVLQLKNVHFLGSISDENRNALIEICRAVVLPSHIRSEAFGMTLLEGARASRPLISCEIGTGTSWINIDGETGLIIPPGDGRALAVAINKLASDLPLCKRLGAGARSRWNQFFTLETVGRNYYDLYTELLRD